MNKAVARQEDPKDRIQAKRTSFSIQLSLETFTRQAWIMLVGTIHGRESVSIWFSELVSKDGSIFHANRQRLKHYYDEEDRNMEEIALREST